MSQSVNAPEGFEGMMWFDDAIREYRVAFRRIGDTWWTNCYDTAGGVHLVESERTARAERTIHDSMAINGLIAGAA